MQDRILSILTGMMVALVAALLPCGSAQAQSAPGPQVQTQASPAATRQFTRERNIDRSGNDIKVETLAADATADDCADRCARMPNCLSFTFVKRSTTVPQPVCRLKDQVPFGHQSSCCTSGLLHR